MQALERMAEVPSIRMAVILFLMDGERWNGRWNGYRHSRDSMDG